MKKISIQYSFVLFTLAFAFGSCKDEFDNVEIKRFALNTDQAQVVQGLAVIENVIVTDWVTATANLKTAVVNLAATPSSSNLTNTQNLWKLARNPWESNESFGFGPVGYNGIDGNTDDWPFDVTSFKLILASNQTLDAAFVAQMTTSTKGFHAIEYLIFGTEGNKIVNDFTAREYTLLNLLSADLKIQADLLKSQWTAGTEKSFYDDFKNAGQGTSSYPTATAALAEVLGSMVDIMVELPNSKIEIPLAKQDASFLESYFADYSLQDYRNNINGVYSVYVGKYGAITTVKSIRDLVNDANPTINEKVLTQFKLCLALIDLISPTTMNQAIVTKQDQLRDLQDELRKLNKILEGEVKVVLGL